VYSSCGGEGLRCNVLYRRRPMNFQYPHRVKPLGILTSLCTRHKDSVSAGRAGWRGVLYSVRVCKSVRWEKVNCLVCLYNFSWTRLYSINACWQTLTSRAPTSAFRFVYSSTFWCCLDRILIYSSRHTVLTGYFRTQYSTYIFSHGEK
jgi:hypothetical protein